jgi:hypothetical protein
LVSSASIRQVYFKTMSYFGSLAVFALMHVVNGAYNCPSGWNGKSGTPMCAGAVASSCSASTCCDAVPTCASYAAAWAITQLAGGGCAADTKFFDMKKTAVEVASPAGTAEVKAACCTPFAQAKCSDWVGLGSCPSGQKLVGTNSAPPDNNDGKTLSQAKYREMCCVVQLQKCSAFAVAWGITQLAGGGCAAPAEKSEVAQLDVETLMTNELPTLRDRGILARGTTGRGALGFPNRNRIAGHRSGP